MTKELRKSIETEKCLNNLYNFIEKEKRLPNRRQDTRYPYQILYRLRINRKIYKKKYPELIQKIEKICKDLDLNPYNSWGLVNLYEFLKKNKTLPRANKEGENIHYRNLFKLRKGEFDKKDKGLVKKIKNLCKEIHQSTFTEFLS